MKFKKLAILAALSAASSVTFAAGAFDGPFVQAGVGLAKTGVDWSVDAGTLSTDDDSFIGQVAGGYSHSFGNFNLATSAYYTIGDQKAGKFSDGTDTVEAKGKNTWGISIDPGYYINPQTLAYVKVGYVATTAEISMTGAGSADEKFHGYAYGAGVKYAFTPNLYGVAEIQQANFKDKTFDGLKVEPDSLTGIIGVGYKF